MKGKIRVLKFGGSSVANATNIKKVLDIITAKHTKHPRLVVVVSALGGVTDALSEAAQMAASHDIRYRFRARSIVLQHRKAVRALLGGSALKKTNSQIDFLGRELKTMLDGVYRIGESSPRTIDSILSFGERLSSYLIGEALRYRRIPTEILDAREFIRTDDHFGSAHVLIKQTYAEIAHHFRHQRGVSVIGGFIASTQDGVTTTLGRGGSDYTAALLGAALNADVIEIWTDVDGVLTADPRRVSGTFPLPEISYEEAGELAHFGAKVIHPKTMKPARLKNIPIDIKNTFNAEGRGTRITSSVSGTHEYAIAGISTLTNVALVHLQSYDKDVASVASRVFAALSHAGIDILLTTQASHEQSLSIAIRGTSLRRARMILEGELALELSARQVAPLSFEEHLSIIAIVGKRMKGIPGMSGRFFTTLGNAGVNIVAIAQGSSELNISAVIDSRDESRALHAVHNAFFASHEATHVFLIGTGLIGSTLLKQIEASDVSISVPGIMNSKRMRFNQDGIRLSRWERELADEGERSSLHEFVRRVQEWPVTRKVFVDCTASAAVSETYPALLGAGVAVVTPNKKANSGRYDFYERLKRLAREHRAPYLYETTVGAGLPVLSTLHDLVRTNDSVVRIDAVLSGTLSYMFNRFCDGNEAFSDILKDAQAKGYTEPDPRDDLNGMDVARKALILCRESGLQARMSDIKVRSFLPKRCFDAPTINAFYRELARVDETLADMRERARTKGKKLRYVASLSKKQAIVGLREVDSSSPFHPLRGSDNLIAFTTKRYAEHPLIIRGAGAGAEVTAAGVLADILKAYPSI